MEYAAAVAAWAVLLQTAVPLYVGLVAQLCLLYAAMANRAVVGGIVLSPALFAPRLDAPTAAMKPVERLREAASPALLHALTLRGEADVVSPLSATDMSDSGTKL